MTTAFSRYFTQTFENAASQNSQTVNPEPRPFMRGRVVKVTGGEKIKEPRSSLCLRFGKNF
ncbi:Zinc Finger Protein Castor 1 [Manis pentadactyla]|nr:Zinc Finger Protein Castor 1 [Manis pentadactyla]